MYESYFIFFLGLLVRPPVSFVHARTVLTPSHISGFAGIPRFSADWDGKQPDVRKCSLWLRGGLNSSMAHANRYPYDRSHSFIYFSMHTVPINFQCSRDPDHIPPPHPPPPPPQGGTKTTGQCSGYMTFWCGSGSADPCLWLMDPDPDPAIFVIDLKDKMSEKSHKTVGIKVFLTIFACW